MLNKYIDENEINILKRIGVSVGLSANAAIPSVRPNVVKSITPNSESSNRHGSTAKTTETVRRKPMVSFIMMCVVVAPLK